MVASGPPWLVSGFRFRARLGFSIPSTLSGPRGITPAFGYSAPHSSARGTSTLLNNALLSAHYDPLRDPNQPPSETRTFGLDPPVRASLPNADHLPYMPCSLPRWTGEVLLGSLVSRSRDGLFPHRTWPSRNEGPVGIHNIRFEACSSFTRVTACRFARPPFVDFFTRLRYSPLPDCTAC